MPRDLNIPRGMTLDSLLNMGADPENFSIDLEAFDRLAETHDPDGLEWLNNWIEPQSTCSLVMREHGADGLSRVLKGIATASAAKGVHMGERVAAAAGFYGIRVL